VISDRSVFKTHCWNKNFPPNEVHTLSNINLSKMTMGDLCLWKWELSTWKNVEIGIFHVMSDLELFKITLKELGNRDLVTRHLIWTNLWAWSDGRTHYSGLNINVSPIVRVQSILWSDKSISTSTCPIGQVIFYAWACYISFVIYTRGPWAL
jgi:hypothetical protein